jgi:malate synthase
LPAPPGKIVLFTGPLWLTTPLRLEMKMGEYVETGDLRVDKGLHELVRDEIAPGTGVDAAAFWQSLGGIVADLGPENAALLEKRDAFQKQLDDWHRERKGRVIDTAEYRKFLRDIGYMVPEGNAFEAGSGRQCL